MGKKTPDAKPGTSLPYRLCVGIMVLNEDGSGLGRSAHSGRQHRI
jgi:hypothetical protein